MLFKGPRVEKEMQLVHPKARAVAVELDAYCKAKGYAEVTITHVERYIREQVEIYWKNIQRANPKLTEAEAKAKAAAQPTWHFHLCAIDFRDYVYTTEQAKDIVAWLRKRCPVPEWEVLWHDVGAGHHLHIAIRDEAWKASHPAH